MNIISFEGPEGVGKTTISKALIEKISIEKASIKKLENFSIEYYREPMFFREEIFANNIMNYEYLFLLFSVSRKKMLQQINKNANLIIIDRYIDSTLVYQFLLPFYKKNTSEHFDLSLFFKVNKELVFGNDENFFPLITFILEAEIDDLRKRNVQKSFDKVDDKIIQDLYRLLPYIYPNRIFYYFNTSLQSKDEIVEKIMEVLTKNALFL